MKTIEYKGGYKYQLHGSYFVMIDLKQPKNIVTDYIHLNPSGLLEIKRGYCWDGPSGPTIDTKNFMRGSLVHDVLYQLMRYDHLNRGKFRAVADKILREHCIEDGMGRFRAWIVYHGVQFGGEKASKASSRKKVITAP